MKVKIQDRDRGYKALMRAASGSRQGRRLRVGVSADEETERIAAIHEFGTERIPARSFVGAWFDENRHRMEEDLRRVAQQVLKGANREQLLTELGHRYRDEMQARIIRGLTPRLAASTIAQKRRRGDPATPLVTSSGKLLSSIVAMLDRQIV